MSSMVKKTFRRIKQLVLPPSHEEPSSTSSMGKNTLRRSRPRVLLDQGLEMAKLAEPLIEAIPIAGAPLKAIIETLTKGLEHLDARTKNKEDVRNLVERLDYIRMEVSEANPTPRIMQFTRLLERRSEELAYLQSHPNSDSQSQIAKTVAACAEEARDFVSEFTLSSNIRVMNMMAAMENSMMTTSVFVRNNTLSICVTVEDPFGLTHSFTQMPTSTADVAMLVLEHYRRNPVFYGMLERYINYNLYQVTQEATDDAFKVCFDNHFSTMDKGTALIMNAILFPKTSEPDTAVQALSNLIRCPDPYCGRWIPRKGNPTQISRGGQSFYLQCPGCRRQVVNFEDDTPDKKAEFDRHTTSDDVQWLRRIVFKYVKTTRRRRDSTGFYSSRTRRSRTGLKLQEYRGASYFHVGQFALAGHGSTCFNGLG